MVVRNDPVDVVRDIIIITIVAIVGFIIIRALLTLV
jgi:hypothetical protein